MQSIDMRFIIQVTNDIILFYFFCNLKEYSRPLEPYFPIGLNSEHFSLASAIAKALVSLCHSPYKSAATEHPRIQHGMSTVYRADVYSYL